MAMPLAFVTGASTSVLVDPSNGICASSSGTLGAAAVVVEAGEAAAA
eukprot:CAMPEP_0181189112 /NCGR_PEP_ID=MMETSP1096-20121128/11487_1 /TAXON_ID=156174 ORGANISM="Chrysochromulina ericina, Strain CCMP281" /NCGR_SAMPLE_ID=MMETSP1096 /ASSEMBLY_ACC=CAM_ASM_000453 /LENGTH=46 /DNA_ID= /DNA_START= /DNA_END= /DNA_ORIENTATION=